MLCRKFDLLRKEQWLILTLVLTKSIGSLFCDCYRREGQGSHLSNKWIRLFGFLHVVFLGILCTVSIPAFAQTSVISVSDNRIGNMLSIYALATTPVQNTVKIAIAVSDYGTCAPGKQLTMTLIPSLAFKTTVDEQFKKSQSNSTELSAEFRAMLLKKIGAKLGVSITDEQLSEYLLGNTIEISGQTIYNFTADFQLPYSTDNVNSNYSYKVIVVDNAGKTIDETSWLPSETACVAKSFCSNFADVSQSSTALYDAVYYLCAKGYVQNSFESSDSKFHSETNILRAEVAKMLVVPLHFTQQSLSQDVQYNCSRVGSRFTDVSTNEWYCSFINVLVDKGIGKGFDDGTFKPATYLTREQAVAFIHRSYSIKAGNTTETNGKPMPTEPTFACKNGSQFTDVDKDRWSCQYINALKYLYSTKKCLSSLTTTDKFLPTTNITRGEFAQVLKCFLIEVDPL